jgi:hypothetical protein
MNDAGARSEHSASEPSHRASEAERLAADASRLAESERLAADASRPAEAERPSLLDAVGGPLGVAESSLPPITFVTAYTVSGEAVTAAWIAVAIGVAAAAARIVRGQTPQYALAGLVGIALAAFIVSRTGRAEDFFVPGLLANAAYALGCGISIAVGRPAVGLAIGLLRGEGAGWRANPTRVRAYTKATWLWVGVFSARLAVQLPLYLTGAVVALGTARVAMGVPIFALAVWLTWLILRAHEPDAPLPGGAGSKRAED